MDAVAPAPDRAQAVPRPSSARAWVLALVAWSLLVWGTRIDNILADEALDGAGTAWRVALALSFVVLAVVVAARWWRRPGPAGRPWAGVVLAWWTVAVWSVRGVGIAAGGHDAAFIAVHVALAVVSIALALVVLGRLPDRPSPLRS